MSNGVETVSAKQLQGIELTQAAKQHFLGYLNKQQDITGVRLYLKKSGCSGLSYEFDYVSKADATDLEFDCLAPYQLLIEKKSYPIIQGTKIDYKKEGLNFRLVFDNPNQTGQCGCGESFTVDTFDDN